MCRSPFVKYKNINNLYRDTCSYMCSKSVTVPFHKLPKIRINADYDDLIDNSIGPTNISPFIRTKLSLKV